jgi:succinoglycan biosynthesis transport protein ExoP
MNGSPERARRISLRDLLTVFFSKLHVFLGILVTVVAVTLAVSFFTDPIYKVTGNVLVKPLLEQNLKLMAPPSTQLSTQPVTVQDINSEVNILNAPQLLRQVVTKLDLTTMEEPKSILSRGVLFLLEQGHRLLVAMGLSVQPTPEDQAVVYLQKKLDIKPIALSNVVEVSLTGTSPEMITKIVNTLLEDYIDYHVAIYRAKGARAFYTRQADIFAGSLKKAEDDLEKFKKEWSIIEITAQNEANIELLRTLRENLSLVQANAADRQTKVGVQQRNLAKTGDVGAFTKDMQSAILEELVRALGPLLTERERIGMHFKKSSPKYQALNLQVKELQQAYKKQIKELLQGNALDLSGLNTYARVLKKHIKDVEDKSLLLSEKQVEFERLVRDLKQQEKNYLLYLNKTEEARIEEQQDNSRVSNVSVTNWAKLPSVPIFPKKGLMTILSLVIGSFLGIAGAFTAYYMDHTVKTPEDIARNCRSPMLTFIADQHQAAGRAAFPGEPGGKSQAPVFSQLPLAPGGSPQTGRGGVPLWMAEPQRYPGLLDSFRNLKNYLHSQEESSSLKVVQFTGADRNAGTSTMACNLALVLAWDLSDHRILLVDANLANPSLHRALGVAGEPGLLNYLTGDLTLQQVVQPYLRPNLGVISVGKTAGQVLSPFDLLKLDTFLKEVQHNYDYVVVDSAPILRSSDSFSLSGKVDGVIFVAEANHTRYEVINDMESRLAGNARLAGIVLNKRRFVIPKGLYNYI